MSSRQFHARALVLFCLLVGAGTAPAQSPLGGWDASSFAVVEAQNATVSITVDSSGGINLFPALINQSASGSFVCFLNATDSSKSVMISGTLQTSGLLTFDVTAAEFDAGGAGSGPRAVMGWGEFWGGYWYYLTHPSAMDDDLETGFYIAGGTAGVATVAAGGAVALGVNPVVWGGTAGGAAAGSAVATYAEAVSAFGGFAAVGRLIGMGRGAADAIARTGSITLPEIQAAGITLPVARWWVQFYQNAVGSGTGGAAAPARVELWQRIVQLLGG